MVTVSEYTRNQAVW